MLKCAITEEMCPFEAGEDGCAHGRSGAGKEAGSDIQRAETLRLLHGVVRKRERGQGVHRRVPDGVERNADL